VAEERFEKANHNEVKVLGKTPLNTMGPTRGGLIGVPT
jgi:hypothetical protein